jgi:uncharacterized membrane protein
MRKWIPLLIVAVAIIASVAVYPNLPQTVPTHWDMLGRPNGWGSRVWGAWVLPIVMLLLWALTRVLPTIDPRGANYAKFGGAFEAIVISILLYMLGLHLIILRASLGYPVAMQRVLPIGVGILLVLIGNLLPRARPNWFIGIRTPWTLSSDRVWEKTHRVGGRAFVAGGLVILIAALVVAQWAHYVLVAVVVVCSLGAVLYSYIAWKREQTPAPVTT